MFGRSDCDQQGHRFLESSDRGAVGRRQEKRLYLYPKERGLGKQGNEERSLRKQNQGKRILLEVSAAG